MPKSKNTELVVLWSILAILVIVLLFSVISLPPIHLGEQKVVAQQLMPRTTASFTPFDVAKAHEMMDKDGDGACDICGMPIDQCISSGMMQCTMDSNAKIGLLGSAHIHTTLENLDFSDPKYNVKSKFVHVEGGDGKKLHFHATGVPLSLFFESIEVEFSNPAVIVNGKIVKEGLEYSPKDGDKIKIEEKGKSA
ncbi:MAG: hypothetical protein QW331_02980 [Candidatus Woesearchaeota archaeon]